MWISYLYTQVTQDFELSLKKVKSPPTSLWFHTCWVNLILSIIGFTPGQNKCHLNLPLMSIFVFLYRSVAAGKQITFYTLDLCPIYECLEKQLYNEDFCLLVWSYTVHNDMFNSSTTTKFLKRRLHKTHTNKNINPAVSACWSERLSHTSHFSQLKTSLFPSSFKPGHIWAPFISHRPLVRPFN